MDSGARRWEIALRTRLGHLNPQENFPGAWYASGGAGAARLPVGNRANSRPGFVAVGPNWPAGGWRSPGSLLALAGEGSGIRGDPSEFKGRPIARLNRIGNLRASVEEFLEFARRDSANGTPLEVVSGGTISLRNRRFLGTPSKFFGALRAQHITPPH